MHNLGPTTFEITVSFLSHLIYALTTVRHHRLLLIQLKWIIYNISELTYIIYAVKLYHHALVHKPATVLLF